MASRSPAIVRAPRGGLRAAGLVALALSTSAVPTAAAQDAPPDPRALLEAAREACRGLAGVRYRGRFEELGERHAAGVTLADVRLARGGPGGGGEVRFRVEGERWFRERTTAAVLDAAFDGALLRRRDPARRAVRERRFEDLAPGAAAWPQAAGELGAGGNGVVLWALVSDGPFERWLASERLELEGRAAVQGVLCDVVVIPGDEPHESTRVFLGVEDRLPRKVEELFVMLTDRVAGSLLTLTDLRVEGEPAADAFRLAVPEGYTLEPDAPRPVEDTLVAVGRPAPAFTLRDPEGQEHTLSALRGRVVVLDFWGTWCGPCIRKLPELQAVHARNRGRAVTVLGISCHEAPNARPGEVLARQGCDFGLLLHGDAVAAAYGVSAFPSVVVVAPDGSVAFRRRGGASAEELQAALEAALDDAPR